MVVRKAVAFGIRAHCPGSTSSSMQTKTEIAICVSAMRIIASACIQSSYPFPTPGYGTWKPHGSNFQADSAADINASGRDLGLQARSTSPAPTPTGSPVSFHAVDHVNTNAAGLPHVFDIASLLTPSARPRLVPAGRCLAARQISRSARAHSGHITPRSAQNQRELLRSQTQVRPHARDICAGRNDPCTRPGLQADLPLPGGTSWPGCDASTSNPTARANAMANGCPVSPPRSAYYD